ncbi:MAG TPA: hypothetical protein VK629_15210 [Steroidobacteraceae bacterium]|nr:hypothetical protein [Steroidobacteraceae bacterium]
MNIRKLVLLNALSAALVAAGCSGGGTETAEAPPTQTTTPTQPDPTAPKAENFTAWLKGGVLAKGEDDGALPEVMDNLVFDHSGNEIPDVFAEVIPPAQPVVVPPDSDT